jgi:hypothetical protein
MRFTVGPPVNNVTWTTPSREGYSQNSNFCSNQRPLVLGTRIGENSGTPVVPGLSKNSEEPLMHKTVPLGILLVLATALFAADAADKPQRTDAEQKAMARIQQLGGLVLELAQNDSRLEVSYQQASGKFSDDYLVPLKDLKDLVHLNLAGKEVTDPGLAHLKGLTTLTRLHLEKTKITDKGLDNLKGLVNLEYLNLYGTAVSDVGLVNLEGMKKLKNLYLWQTKVTDAGVAKLKKALPQVDVVRGFDDDKPKVDKPKVDKPKVDKPKVDKPKVDKKKEEKKPPDKKEETKKAK